MDDFPSLRSLEGIGRPLGTERPSFSPLRESDFTRPSGPEESAGRERPEERFEARIEEAERRARGERTRGSGESSEGEPRVREETTGGQSAGRDRVERGEDPGENAPDGSQAADGAKVAQSAEEKPRAVTAELSLRFAGAESVPQSLGSAGGVQVVPTQNTTHAPADLAALAAVPLASVLQPGVTGLDYGTVSANGTTDSLQSLLGTTLPEGQGKAGGESFRHGGDSSASTHLGGTQASGATTPVTGAAEAFGAVLSSELADSSGEANSATSRTDANAREALPTQREIEQAGDVLRQFRMQLQPGLNQATIHLRPAHLGRVAIRLHVEEGRLRATLRAEKPETLGILEDHLPELRAALEEQGFEAQEFDLGLGDSGESEFKKFFQEENAGFGDQASTHSGRSARSAEINEAEMLRDALQSRLDADNPSVDTYA